MEGGAPREEVEAPGGVGGWSVEKRKGRACPRLSESV